AQRVYVAGLSAGGAMAALLGREYPEVFAAVGVHSGLQAGAAHNMMGALSAMKTGAKTPPAHPGTPTHSKAPALPPPPLIVFHGDADTTVHARNGEQLIEATLSALAAAAGGARETVEAEHTGQSPGGKRYTRTVYTQGGSAPTPHAPPGQVVAEHWVLHGAGHAWAGGHAGGSHTDPDGVGATQEMLRFFLAYRRS
ncbi:MAG: PHB depolymerase family esterase, partial [Burkholderiaceae bacterium]|nr:PHB depolymerase family esterase [Burkholderiaceae bacterium]